MEYSKFVVYKEPYCVWDFDLNQTNLEFIKSMRPEYFDNVVLHNSKQLEEEEKNLAALSIRLAYFHGMETLFSLICATLQAPECVVGWLQKYTVNGLRNMIKDIDSEQDIWTKRGPTKFSWEELSNAFNSFKLEDVGKEQKIKAEFGKFWKKLAAEFQDKKSSDEYNNIKHGLRIQSGGVHVAMGEEREFGVSPPPENFISMGGNDFGTSFSTLDKICQDGVPNGKYHFCVRKNSVNWDPEIIGIRVRLISNSIKNILSFLEILNGVNPETVKFSWPQDLSIFEEAWKSQSGVSNFNVAPIINQEDIQIFNKDEILAIYHQSEEHEGNISS